jgi:hypothetical protein
MVEAYVMGMVMPQEAEEKNIGMNDIEAISGTDDDVDVPAMTDEQATLLHCSRPPTTRRRLMSTHASVLVNSVGPPSAEICRAAASFP